MLEILDHQVQTSKKQPALQQQQQLAASTHNFSRQRIYVIDVFNNVD